MTGGSFLARRQALMPRLKALGAGGAAHLSYARALFGHGRDEEALEAVNHALSLDERLHLGYFLRAEIGARDSAPDKAEADYLKCLELSPRFADAAVRLGDLRSFNGRYEEALEAYERAMGLTPEGATLGVRAASAWFGLGVYPRATKAFKKAAEIDPGLVRGGHTVGDYHSLLRTIARCHQSRPRAVVAKAAEAKARRAHPAFRPDLIMVAPSQEGSEAWVVKDVRRACFFELSPLEELICRQLD